MENYKACEVEHCISMAKTAKFYAIRAKRQGAPIFADHYVAERKHWMPEARRLSD